jgi:hypothetical protein
MCKRFLLVATVILMASPAFAGVGIFDFNQDVGTPKAIGSTAQYIGGGVDRYLVSGGGNDIWGNADNFHFAYNEVSGDLLLSAAVTWQAAGDNEWSKAEVMFRDTTDTSSTHYSTATRGGPGDNAPGDLGQGAYMQQRPVAGGGSNGENYTGLIAQRIGVQRVTSNGYSLVQSLVDQGSGWELVGTSTRPSPVGDNYLAGIAVTSHDQDYAVQAWFDDVTYDTNPTLIDILQAGDPLAEACSDRPGFLVTGTALPAGWGWWDEDGDGGIDGRGWQYILAEYVTKNNGFTGFWAGDEAEYPAEQNGSRVVPLVNLHDSGGRWAFDNDESFPGIDGFEQPTQEGADGDFEDNFGVLVEACIELTEGIHILGGVFDDGILIRIGGVEIGRTNGWDQTGQWVFNAPATGVYSLEAIGFEGGGGAQLELYEFLPDGTMILLGDVDAGGSAVFVPEPATIALLGFGGLSMLRLRRKS